MKPPRHLWPEHVKQLTVEEMRLLAGGMAHQLSRLDLSIPDILTLQWHYYRAALDFTLSHTALVREVHLQARPCYFLNLFPTGLEEAATHPLPKVQALRARIQRALHTQEPVAPEELAELGFWPQDFSRVFGLTQAQRGWDDLLNVQLRHLDPRGMWHAIVLFTNPRGEDLQLHLMYREAEVYGYTIGLEAEEAWRFSGAPTVPATPGDVAARLGLALHDFPSHLAAPQAALP